MVNRILATLVVVAVLIALVAGWWLAGASTTAAMPPRTGTSPDTARESVAAQSLASSPLKSRTPSANDVRALPTFELGRLHAQELLDKKYRRFEKKVRAACPSEAFVSELLGMARHANEKIAFAAAETGHGVRSKRDQLKLEMDITEEMYDIICAKLPDARPASAQCERALSMCRGGKFVSAH